MNLIEKKIFAVAEAWVLWDYIAETGITDKQEAINRLYRESKLHKSVYECRCPLCDELRGRDADPFRENRCRDCPWPRKGMPDYCLHIASPYREWEGTRSKESATKVFNLLETMDI